MKSMPTTVSRRVAACQSSAGADADAPMSTAVDVDLEILRAVISDLGWTFDAIAAAMGRDETYKSHISRVVSGERPMSHEFIKALPDDIEAEWHARLAEHFGRIVVAPVQGPDAVRNLVSGLIGVLAPQLPARATSMAKATLQSADPVRRRA